MAAGVIAGGLLALAGCDGVAGLFRGDPAEVERAYAQFRAAMRAGDLAALREHVARGKAQELSQPDAQAKLALAAALYPEPVTVQGIEIRGRSATLRASARTEHGTAEGTVLLVREDGRWRVAADSWEIKVDLSGATAAASARAAPRDDVVRHSADEWARLRGQWRGTEVTGGGEWTFSFGDGYAVVVRTPQGDGYEGVAGLRFDLGPQPVRVPPGSGLLDVDVTSSPSPELQGKTSLGVYFTVGEAELKFCGSRPGVHERALSYDTSTATLRCFRLNRVSAEPLPSSVPAAAAAVPPAAAEPAAPTPQSRPWNENGDPGLSGEAELTLDGVPYQFGLLTNFFSDTSLRDPRRASLHFQPRTATDNTSGLVLVLDATRVGRHFAEGNIGSPFSDDPSKRVGDAAPEGTRAALNWIRYGGQYFFPHPSCVIVVDSPYTGTPDGTLSGSVESCPVHSAGIDHRLAGVRFTVRGAQTKNY